MVCVKQHCSRGRILGTAGIALLLALCLLMWMQSHYRVAHARQITLGERGLATPATPGIDLAYFQDPGSATDTPLTVSLEMDFGPWSVNYPVVTTTLQVQAKSSYPPVAKVLTHTPGELNLDDTSTALLGLSPYQIYLFQLESGPKITVTNSLVTLVETSTATLYSLPYFLGDDITINNLDGDMFVRLSGDRVLTDTTRIVNVSLEAMRIISFTTVPMPLTDTNSGHLSWIVPAGQPVSDIAIRTHPAGLRLALVGAQITTSILWWSLSQVMRYAWVFLLIVWSFRLWRDKGKDKISRRPTRPDSGRKPVLWILLLLPIIVCAWTFEAAYLPQVQAVLTEWLSSLDAQYYPPDTLPRVLINLARAYINNSPLNFMNFLLFTYAVLFFITANRQLGIRNGKRMFIASILGVALFALPIPRALIFGYTSYITDYYFRRAPDWHILASNNIQMLIQIISLCWLLMVIVFVWLLTYYLIAGTARFALALWPASWSAEKVRQLTSRRHVRASLILLTTLIVVQPVVNALWFGYEHQSLLVTTFAGVPEVQAQLIPLQNFMKWFQLPESSLSAYEAALLGQIPGILVYIALAGLIGLLYRASRGSKNPFFSTEKARVSSALTLLFASFVVGIGGLYLGLNLPLAFFATIIIMPRLLNSRLEQAEKEIQRTNPWLAQNIKRSRNYRGNQKPSVIIAYRDEIMERAKALEDLGQQQNDLYNDYSKGTLSPSDYTKKRADLANEQIRLTRGGELYPNSTDKSLLPAQVRLPDKTSPFEFALALGPYGAWWENGMRAVKIGGLLAVLPIAYYLYILVTQDVVKFFSLSGYLSVLTVFTGLLEEIAFWLVAAFVLGCLYAYLPGTNGVLKGASLAGVFIVAQGLQALLSTWFSGSTNRAWLFRSLEFLVFLTALGLLMDWHTVSSKSLQWHYLLDYYHLNNVRTLVAYAAPLALALFAIGQQLLSGSAQQAVSQILENLPKVIPNLTGG